MVEKSVFKYELDRDRALPAVVPCDLCLWPLLLLLSSPFVFTSCAYSSFLIFVSVEILSYFSFLCFSLMCFIFLALDLLFFRTNLVQILQETSFVAVKVSILGATLLDKKMERWRSRELLEELIVVERSAVYRTGIEQLEHTSVQTRKLQW
jgi:hypothetical protein